MESKTLLEHMEIPEDLSPEKENKPCSDESNVLSLVFEPIMMSCGLLKLPLRENRSVTGKAISNSFKDIDFKVSLSSLVSALGEREDITNILMILEALWWWIGLNESSGRRRLSQMRCPTDVLWKIEHIVKRRGWGYICISDLEEISKIYPKIKLIADVCDSLKRSIPKRMYFSGYCEMVNEDALTFRRLIFGDEKLKFFHNVRGCYRQDGKCGFILKVVLNYYTGNAEMILCTDKEDYIDTGIHLHQEVRAENIHLIIDYKDTRGFLFPFSWSPALHCNIYEFNYYSKAFNDMYRHKAVHLCAVIFPQVLPDAH